MSEGTMVDLNFDFTYNGETYKLNEIVDKRHIITMEGVDKPIISKDAIMTLCNKFNFHDLDWELFTPTNSVGVYVKLFMGREDGTKFIGDGEASPSNCKGFSRDFLLSMAIKRARSRAVLNELGIMAYGEDEADDFKNQTQAPVSAKKIIIGEISTLAQELPTPLSSEALSETYKTFAGLDMDSKLTLESMEIPTMLDFYSFIKSKVEERK